MEPPSNISSFKPEILPRYQLRNSKMSTYSLVIMPLRRRLGETNQESNSVYEKTQYRRQGKRVYKSDDVP